MNKLAEQRVAKGAELLDSVIPNWREKINDELDMADCNNCVVGQVFYPQNYFEAVSEELGLSYAANGIFTDWNYGFDTSPSWDDGDDEPSYTDLQEAWVKEIYA